MSHLRIGISGWRYKPWRGVFYPKKLPQHQELTFASRTFNSIELNGSFYSLQRPSSYREWASETPDDFVFSIKGGRFITHMKKLRNVESALGNFFAQGVLGLGEKLGPCLWQFPPNMQLNLELFEQFFDLLPRDTAAAAKLGERHDEKLKPGRVDLTVEKNIPMRHAVEIRHETFRDPAFIKLLRKYNVALVVADTAGKWPLLEDVTADFVYIRLHGDEQLYVSGYSDKALDFWAERIDAWRKGAEPRDARRVVDKPGKKRKSRDVFIYFDNDAKVCAPEDAKRLMARLEVAWNPPSQP